MFQIKSIESITYTAYPDLLNVTGVITIHGEDEFVVNYAFRASDPHGVAPTIKEWIEANPSFPIGPYVPPTEEETRANLLPLTRVVFRIAFKNAGMTTAVINAAIAAIEDPNLQEDYQIFWEDTQSFNRLDPFVLMVAAHAAKTPEQIDAVWIGAVAA